MQKKIWANSLRITVLFTPKNCHLNLKNMGLGSGIRKNPTPDPESRGQKSTGSRVRNTAIL